MNESKEKYNSKISLAILFILCFIGTLLVQHHSFFWDTIQLSSKHAHWYYDNNFSHFFLPDHIDSGHPPLMGIYLAFAWKIFGRSLQVSHWAMLPFLIGLSFNLFWIYKFVLRQNILISTIITLCAAPIISQCALVSPDVILMCGFLMTINGILKEKPVSIIFGIVLLCLISMRGMMTASGIGLFYLYYTQFRFSLNQTKQVAIRFGPGFLLAIIFIIGHYLSKNWIGFHADSPWQPSFALADFKTACRNIGVTTWRFIDLGLIWLWGIIILISISNKDKLKSDQTLKYIFILFFTSVLLLTPTAILFYSLSAHRYFLPCYISLIISAFYLIDNYANRFKNIFLLIAFIGLFSGNLWIYPKNVAQGWDSTLAHIPYHHVRSEMMNYLENEKISTQQIASFFPNISTFRYTDLKEHGSFLDANKVSAPYILYSNVFNINDTMLELLSTFKTIKTIRYGPIFMTLYNNPDY